MAFHVGFNVVLVLVSIGLLGPLGRMLTRFLPEKTKRQAEAALGPHKTQW